VTNNEEDPEYKSIAFLFLDKRYDISSLIRAEYESKVLRIHAHPPLNPQMWSYLTPYIVARYSEYLEVDPMMFGVVALNGNPALKLPYEHFVKRADTDKRVVKDLAEILSGIERQITYKEPRHHSDAYEPIPDIEHMTDAEFNRWEHYFEDDGKTPEE